MTGGSTHGHPETAGAVSGEWLRDALSESTDVVLYVDGETRIQWCNRAAYVTLGFIPAEVLGRSFAEFVHPDDIGRAAEVLALAAEGAFDETPITPALYRVLAADGGWVNLDINASPTSDGSMLVTARQGGDLVLTDRLLEAISSGEPFDQQVALVMELALWRHPREGYVITYRGEAGEARSVTANMPFEAVGPAAPTGPAPWDAVVVDEADIVVNDLSSLAADSPVAGPELVAAARAAGFEGCLAAPVSDPGHAEGAWIVIWTTAEGPTTSGHRYAMSNMRRAFALALQQRAQVRALERAARVDQVTGATSRARFLELIDQIELDAEPDARHAVLYIDLDGFKSVNDRHGHAAGDLVLRATANRIARVLSPEAVVSRLGGDEFAVLCPRGTIESTAADAAARIVTAVASPIEIGRGTVVIGASVGLAYGDEGEGLSSVLEAADGALLAAKAAGRGCWRLAPSA